jgi:A/G-specific adenine glycosylase
MFMDYTFLHSTILTWFDNNQKVYPWRSESPHPYHVLLSEYMLQQTQASRIALKFPEFINTFPTIEKLSNATNAQMIIAWQGMGYNNRAIRLRDCAKQIMDTFNGIIPNNYTDLLSLPGIGTYTASAILSFAFKQNISVIDVNIHRIYSRVFGLDIYDTKTKSEVKTIAEHIYPRDFSSSWHQALMDIGSSFCKAQNPKCILCPIPDCLYKNNPSLYRIKPTKSKKTEASFRNIPNRLWRGKTIEFLRNDHQLGHHLKDVLHSILKQNPNEIDITWFKESIIPSLIKDHLIEYNVENNHLSLKE